MIKKTSTRKMNVLLIGVILMTLVGILITTISYHNIQQEALKMGKLQLEQVNEVSTKLIAAEVENSARSLDGFVTDTINEKEQLALPDNEKSLAELFKHNEAFAGILLFDANGKEIVAEFPEDRSGPAAELREKVPTDPFFASALKGQVAQNGEAYFINHDSFINLYQPIYNHQAKIRGLAVIPLNLEELFITKIQPADTSRRYPLMKNEAMEVVMHPAKEQIGLNIISGRKQEFPELDYSDLQELDEYQKTHNSGSLSYHSYWWNQEDLSSVLKINAFRWVDIGEARFVVANTSDFYEDNGWILQDTLINLGIVVILLVVASLLVLLFRNYAKQNQVRSENWRLKERQILEAEKHELEKTLLQESKMETIGLVTTGIVHDMNNFLTPLIGNIELLMEERQNDPELLGELEEMREAAKKGQQLSSRVLNFSKENDQVKKIQSLDQAVTEAVKTMQILIPKSVTIESQVTLATKAAFQQDEVQVLLYNLITNAYQARSDATIKVTVTEPDEKMQQIANDHSLIYQDKPLAMIQVTDNGPGIHPEIEDKIFTPFFTTKNNEGGTGMGLFNVASIIKKNDWLIDVESSDNGTTFSIGIPIAKDQDPKRS